MSGLLFLTADDFQLAKGQKGNLMCTSIPGFSLILFYSTQCEYCQEFIPIFKRMPGTVSGCQFGMINIQQNKRCALMSRETVAPIQVVPYVLLYFNGKPYMRYNGPSDAREIGRFIVEVAQKMQSKESFVKDERIKKNLHTGIPEFTIGKPLYGDGDDKLCYLDFNDAYATPNASDGQRKQQLHQHSGMGATGRQNYNLSDNSGGR